MPAGCWQSNIGTTLSLQKTHQPAPLHYLPSVGRPCCGDLPNSAAVPTPLQPGRRLRSTAPPPRLSRCHASGGAAAGQRPQEETAVDQGAPPRLLTFAEAQLVASARGMLLTASGFGPAYRITCRDGRVDGPVVGVSDGFTAPAFRLMHCDSLRVFTDRLSEWNGRSARERGAGLGLLVCGAVIAYGAEHGCRKAEILAINDDDATHRRLCNYYKRMGFQTVREVGGGSLGDLPHLLVWGGAGTRMDTDTDGFLRRWSDAIRNRR